MSEISKEQNKPKLVSRRSLIQKAAGAGVLAAGLYVAPRIGTVSARGQTLVTGAHQCRIKVWLSDGHYGGEDIGDDWKFDFKIDGATRSTVLAQGWRPGQQLGRLITLPVVVGETLRSVPRCGGQIVDFDRFPIVLYGVATETDTGGTDDFTVALDGVLTGLRCPRDYFGGLALGYAKVREAGGEDADGGKEAEITLSFGFSAECISH